MQVWKQVVTKEKIQKTHAYSFARQKILSKELAAHPGPMGSFTQSFSPHPRFTLHIYKPIERMDDMGPLVPYLTLDKLSNKWMNGARI